MKKKWQYTTNYFTSILLCVSIGDVSIPDLLRTYLIFNIPYFNIIANPPPNSENLLFNRDILCRLIEKYYTKRRSLDCDIIYAKQIRNQPNITYYPTLPFEEVSFDFKPADI